MKKDFHFFALAGLVFLTSALFVTFVATMVYAQLLVPRQVNSPRTITGVSDFRPNVLIINLDDVAYDQIQYLPETSQFFEQGIKFDDAHVVTPLCCPSRANLLTGKDTHETEIWYNGSENVPDTLPFAGAVAFRDRGLDQSTLATWLKASGYATALVGKYMNRYYQMGEYVPPGWDAWYAFKQDNNNFFNYSLIEKALGPTKTVQYGSAETDYSTDVLREKALKIIDRASQPFFLYFAPFASHAPATPAPRHAALYPDVTAPLLPNYNEADVSDKPTWVRNLTWTQTKADENDSLYADGARSLASTDEAIKALITALEQKGILNNTLIIFTVDNGFSFGSHRYFTKWCEYRECFDVPVWIHYPQGITSPRHSNTLVSMIDIAPTVLEVTGSTATTLLDGKSLVPLFTNELGVAFQDAILGEHKTANAFFDTCRNSQFCGLPSYSLILTDEWKYVEFKNGERELYDRQTDPYELQNVVNLIEHRSIVQDLAARLAQLKQR